MPKSLAGQLIALLLLGLLASHWLVQNLTGKTHGSIHEIARAQLVERYAMAYRVVASCQAACDRAALLAALASGDARFYLGEEPGRAPQMSGDETLLADSVAAGIDRLDAAAVRVRLQHDAGDAPAARPLRVAISAALPGGATLVGVMWPVVRGGAWHWFAHGGLESYAAVLVLAAVFVGRVRRPLRAIGAAYEHISRGEKVAPLRASGPQELREVVASFNVMQERLTRLVTHRTRMLAAIGHDFRTPITSLRLRAELVDDDALRVAMVRTLDEMRQMIDATLSFARDDGMHEDSATIDLAGLLCVLADEQRGLGNDVRWQQTTALPYRCRPLTLQRALRNLIDNAVRYGHRAWLSARQAGDRLLLIVDDDGPGIAEESLHRVFQPFAQIGRSHEAGGVGLGLAIARSYVEAHGGRVVLENRPSGGLRATIQLPVQPSPSLPVWQPAAAAIGV